MACRRDSASFAVVTRPIPGKPCASVLGSARGVGFTCPLAALGWGPPMSEPTDENPPSKRKVAKPPPRTEGARAGRAAIVGRPNAGKSTLLNALIGQKLVIATPLPGTTRTSVLAVYSSDDPPTQIAFIDTPGLHRPKSALGSVLVDQARHGLSDAHVVILVATVPEPRTMVRGVNHLRIPSFGDEDILALIRDVEVPVILALNKIDRCERKRGLISLQNRQEQPLVS